MSGRTWWFMRDADWWTRGAVRRARKEFGPTGPAVMDWLECAAKRQNSGGFVKADPLTIAEDIGTDEVTVRNVVSRLVTMCWLVEHESDGDTFKANVAWFAADQERGLGAERQARFRDKQRESEKPVTGSNASSRLVTRREEKSKETAKAVSSAAKEAEREARLATADDLENCRLFFSLGRARNTKMKVPRSGSSARTTALREMRKLRSEDGNTTDEIQRLIRWLFTDNHKDAVFWGTTIQAPSGLRDHFSEVWSKMIAAETLSTRNGAVAETSLAALIAHTANRDAATERSVA